MCGDDAVDAPETCDDGNNTPGDGCDASCQVEEGARLRVFVTRGRFNGNLGGLTNADSNCTAEANNNNLPGKFTAWLSTSADTAPALRFAGHELPYVLPGADAPIVAQGTQGLFSGALQHAIDRAADGEPLTASEGCTPDGLAWTASKTDGVALDATCKGFMEGGPGLMATAGRVFAADAGWTEFCAVPCSESLRLYCFEQP